jgi:hypothetical protein
MNYIEVPKIEKPLYGNFVYINEKYIKQAMREGKKMKITVPQGSAIVDPWVWKGYGKKMEKEFKIKGKPMILWGGNVDIDPQINQQKLL